MIILSALSLLITLPISEEAFSHYQELTTQLDRQVEWIDDRGSARVSQKQAEKLLTQLSEGMNQESFSMRHSSDWKKGKCFKIIHVKQADQGFRVFFQCAKKGNHKVVTKVKVTTL